MPAFLLDALAAAMPWPAQTLGLIALAVLFSAILRGFTGFGFAIASAPLLTLFMPPAHAVPIIICLQLFAGLSEVRSLAGVAHWPSVRRLAAGALVGTPIGTAALYAVPADPARICIALLAGFAVVMIASGLRFPDLPGRAATLGIGLAAGLANGLAAMPGPPVVAFYMALHFSPEIVRASLLVFFTMCSALALAGAMLFELIRLPDVIFSVVLMPLMWFGNWLGHVLLKRSGGHWHRPVSMVTLAAIAIAAGWKGLSAYL
jgi:uncharacterized membrane protein YfcA